MIYIRVCVYIKYVQCVQFRNLHFLFMTNFDGTSHLESLSRYPQSHMSPGHKCRCTRSWPTRGSGWRNEWRGGRRNERRAPTRGPRRGGASLHIGVQGWHIEATEKPGQSNSENQNHGVQTESWCGD